MDEDVTVFLARAFAALYLILAATPLG